MPQKIKEITRNYWELTEKKACEEASLLHMIRDENCDPEILALLEDEIAFREKKFIPVIRERLAA